MNTPSHSALLAPLLRERILLLHGAMGTKIQAERLGEAVAKLREADYAGANVTVPHKEAVIPFLDGLTPTAEAIGAVNTLVKQDGRLIGHNTDAAGLLADLYAHHVHISKRPVLILGAGGAAEA